MQIENPMVLPQEQYKTSQEIQDELDYFWEMADIEYESEGYRNEQ